MSRFNFTKIIFLMLAIAVTFSSCEAIAGIFKAGVWVGVVIVVVIIALVLWLISKAKK
ncbi:MAG: hypothetical protein ABI691_10460 [Ginsengibacter sp.]